MAKEKSRAVHGGGSSPGMDNLEKMEKILSITSSVVTMICTVIMTIVSIMR